MFMAVAKAESNGMKYRGTPLHHRRYQQALMLIATIAAKESRKVKTADVPGVQL